MPKDYWGGKKSNKRKISRAKRNIVASNQNWTCAECGSKLPPSFHVDHIDPLSKGGTDEVDNLQAVCPNCHSEKSYKEQVLDDVNEDKQGDDGISPTDATAPTKDYW